MEYTRLGTSDLTVSTIGLGTWPLGGDLYGAVDDAQSIDAIRTAVDHGVTLIDTAPSYGDGRAEEIVGRAVSGQDAPAGLRDRLVIATKCGVTRMPDGGVRRDLRPQTIRREIEGSLRRLKTGVIDLYQLHWPDRSTPLEETVDELTRLQSAGAVRYIGISNFPPRRMEAIAGLTNIVCTQSHFSILDRRIEHDVLPAARSLSLGVIGYGTLGGGVLTGKFSRPPDDERGHFYNYFRQPLLDRIEVILDALREIAGTRGVPIAQVAINWARRRDGIDTVLVGAKNREQSAVNARAAEWSLTTDESAAIDRAIATAFAPRKNGS
jgi:aryl-alcohol dehydrogenase-like predicted oxidoreductase